jgi:hypothetical protein
MNNNDEVYRFTLEALNGSLSSHISKVNREQCERFLQDLKQQETCMSVVSRILAEDDSVCNQFIKLLALTILNDWIKLWWNKVPEGTKLSIKQLSLDLLNSSLALSDSGAMRMKIAVILSNVAERVFPQYWSTFIQEMTSLWQSSPFGRQDVILKALEIVVVDSIDADFNSVLPTLRRQEIVTGLVEAQSLLYETSFGYLQYCFQEYTRLSNTGGTGERQRRMYHLLFYFFATTHLSYCLCAVCCVLCIQQTRGAAS